MAEGGARVGAGALRTMGLLVFSFVVKTVAFAGDLSSSSNVVVAVAATSEATAEESSEPVRRLPSGKTRPSEPELAELERSDFLPIKDRWRIGYTGRWWDPDFLNVRENGVVNIDVREGTSRTDHQIALQEAFVEARLIDVSRHFDFASVRAGIQGFTSDFRGFIFSDNQPGIKFFGNFDSNRYQWNVAYFNTLEKDTNSGLNTLQSRHQQVVIANLYRQDFIWLGYTAQLSFHYNLDQAGSQDDGGQHYDTNGFLVRPAVISTVRPHDLHAYYLGWTGDGHIGRLNLTHAFYQVIGADDFNQIANRRVTINAQMAAAEFSYDIDWLRPKLSVFYGSGDSDPRDGTGRGFDSIIDNVNFAGAGFSFFNRQAIRLTQTGVNIVNRFSLLADLRSAKDEGQANFVNPGLFLVGPGLDADLTPKLKALLNVK